MRAFNHRARDQRRSDARRNSAAFTVIELMLAVAILGVIVFALFSVFNQTQKALRRSETNTDVAQKARAVAEMIGLEVEQAQPTRAFFRSNNVFSKEINMLGGMEQQYVPADFVMESPDPGILRRTNFIHSIFFYNNRTNAWQGIGYRVVHFTNGVGSLQRFETNLFDNLLFASKPYGNVGSSNFVNTVLTNRTYRHVADGIVHLSFIPFDRSGRRLGWDTPNGTDAGYDTNLFYVIRRRFDGTIDSAKSDTDDFSANTVMLREAIPTVPNQPNIQYTTAFTFLSNALPAYVEMEFGMLEPETLAQYYTMLDDENPNAAKFLQKQISKVHLFRQRIPIRTSAQ